MSPDGKWRWVKHKDNALVRPFTVPLSYAYTHRQVVNVGDSLEMLSGGFYKGTIHRVVQPPADQRGYERLGTFYFAMTDDSVPLVPLAESPVLQRVGVKRRCADEDAPTMEEWRKARTRAYGRTTLKMKDDGNEEEVLSGVVVKHYN